MPVTILVVDPSLFSLPYDAAFCAALAAAGAAPTLIGRPLRPLETLPSGVPLLPLFYRLAEGPLERWRRLPPVQLLKACEHALGLRAVARLAERRPQAIHFQWLVLPLLDRRLVARARRLAPMVLTVHNAVQNHGEPTSALQARGYEAALALFDRLVVHTDRTRDHLQRQGIPPGRIRLLPHPPMGLPAVAASPRPNGAVRILLFGSIKRYKGADVLVRAGLELARRRRDFVIEIAGQPFIAMDELRAEIAAAGAAPLFRLDLRYLPEDELAARLAAADLVVFPYRDIDASGAFAVAVAQGRPIVASAVGAFAEAPARDHVRLVPPADAGALATALEELIADGARRDALARSVRALRGASLGWDRFAAACLELYAEAGAAHGRAAA